MSLIKLERLNCDDFLTRFTDLNIQRAMKMRTKERKRRKEYFKLIEIQPYERTDSVSLFVSFSLFFYN